MPRKEKLNMEANVNLIRRCISGEIGVCEAAREAGVGHKSIRTVANEEIAEKIEQIHTGNPDAHPLFHSDRGFQYANRTFHHKLERAGITQGMSRVAKCIDNAPMEGFRGILKRERYYGRRFTSKQELIRMITNYINYYNNRRVQRSLGALPPFEKHNLFLNLFLAL